MIKLTKLKKRVRNENPAVWYLSSHRILPVLERSFSQAEDSVGMEFIPVLAALMRIKRFLELSLTDLQ